MYTPLDSVINRVHFLICIVLLNVKPFVHLFSINNISANQPLSPFYLRNP